MKLPTFHTYCEHTTPENALVFEFGRLSVYFSYRTPVAFRCDGWMLVRENAWGPTTGKHLNAIDGGGIATDNRVGPKEFETKLDKIMESM